MELIKIENYTGNEKKHISAIKIFPIFILIAICSLGIGYASLNAVNLRVTGTLGASSPRDIFISAVVDQAENEIQGYYNGTILNSTIQLAADNLSSTKTYMITLYNNTQYVYEYVSTICDQTDLQFYSNNDIEYSLSDISENDEVQPYSSKTFQITFKYKENVTEITNNTLNSCIQFMFRKSIYSFDLSNITSGDSFNLGTIEFDANNQTLYCEMNVNDCINTNENLLSIGQHILHWTIPSSIPGGVNLHVYYPSPDGKIIIAPIMQDEKTIQFKVSYSKIRDNGIIKMAFNGNGLYINGEKVIDRNGMGINTIEYGKLNQKTIEEYLEIFFNRWCNQVLNVSVGSQEGDNRSLATYNVVEIHKRTMAGSEMEILTRVHEEIALEDMPYEEHLAMTYSPEGARFTFDLNNSYNSFNAQTLYAEIYIGDITGSKENILSIGNEIAEWTPLGNNTVNIHLYYPNIGENNTKNIILALNLSGIGFKQWNIPMSILNAEDDILKLALNYNGLYINGVNIFSPTSVNSDMNTNGLSSTGWAINSFLEAVFQRLNLGSLDVGSQQGDNRSYADYYTLRIYDGVVSNADLITLTN